MHPIMKFHMKHSLTKGGESTTLVATLVVGQITYTKRLSVSLMPRSHQTFRPVLAVKLLGIMLRNRCWPTTFHIITAENVDGWC